MKRLSFVLLTMALSFSAMSQDKKAEKGAFGIGFGLGFASTANVQPNVSVQYMLSNNMEIGTPLWLQWNHTRKSSFDTITVPVFDANNDRIHSETEHKATTSQVWFGIAPYFKYHFKTKNNLDIYTGVNVPIAVSTTQKGVTSTITEADNYHRMTSVTTKGPVGVGAGVGILLGCRWFFYENLALGAETNLGFLANMANGKNKSISHVENSGTNNPDVAINPADISSEMKVKNNDIDLSLLRGIGFSLTYYFGGKNKK